MRVTGWSAGAAAFLVLVAGLVGYRVIAPAEIATRARAPYPGVLAASPGVSGELARTPLIVDGRLRVYATKRQVWADTPIDARTENTPYWSLRRWPQQVTGVGAAGRLVVSRWDDGALIALAADSGAVRWRVEGPGGAGGYAGRRTGAATVYRPPGLFVTAEAVIVSSAGGVSAYDPATGAPLWTDAPAAACRTTEFVGSGFWAELVGCADRVLRRILLRSGRALPDWPVPGAAVELLGCLPGGCAGMRAGGQAFRFAGETVSRAPGLDRPGTWLVDDLAVGPEGDGFVARRAGSGAPQWTWSPGGASDRSPARIVAAEPGSVYLLTERHTLVVLATTDGLERSRLPMDRSDEPARWTLGAVYARDRYIVVERLAEHAGAGTSDPGTSDNAYYAGLRPVVLAGT